MPHNNTILLLQNLTANEREAFQHYAASRKYGGRKALEKLLSVVCKYLIDIEKGKNSGKQRGETTNDFLKRITFNEKEFKDEKAKSIQFNTNMSFLADLIKEYFVVKRVIEDDLLKQRFLLEDLRKRNLIDFIEKKDNAITKLPEINHYESVDLYTIRWQMEDHTDRYQEVLLYQKDKATNNVQNAARAIDALFLLNKFRYMCIAHNHNTVASTAEKISILGEAEVFDWVEKYPEYLSDYPLLNTYFLLLKMLQSFENTTLFDAAKAFITANEQQFHTLELDTIYSLLCNQAIKLTNQGQKGFAEIAMNLHKTALENGYFHCNNTTILANYKNMVKLSIQCDKTGTINKWLEELNQHPHKISINIYKHCLACLDFHHAKYKSAIENAKNLRFEDELDKLGNTVLLLRAYFCADERDEFGPQVSKIRATIDHSKEKISDTHWQQYTNFVDILAAIEQHKGDLHLQNGTAAQRADNQRNITEKINNTTPIIYKNWLLEQVK